MNYSSLAYFDASLSYNNVPSRPEQEASHKSLLAAPAIRRPLGSLHCVPRDGPAGVVASAASAATPPNRALGQRSPTIAWSSRRGSARLLSELCFVSLHVLATLLPTTACGFLPARQAGPSYSTRRITKEDPRGRALHDGRAGPARSGGEVALLTEFRVSNPPTSHVLSH